MLRVQLFAVIFIEGFCSLGAEVIALRQIIPHTGSSIVVTAPTIAFFLLALALGYHAGAKIAEDYFEVVARNFLIAALLIGIGLAGVGVDLIFASLGHPKLPIWRLSPAYSARSPGCSGRPCRSSATCSSGELGT